MSNTFCRAFSLSALLTVALPVVAGAEGKTIVLPQPSPRAVVALDLGTTEVRIDYHRPAVKGREIWGKLVPYGEVWRLGANDATKLTVGDPFTLGGREFPAGSYALFAIPGEKSWKVIVNSQAEQWGAYFRKPELDLHTFEVIPESAPFRESMSFTIEPTAPGKAEIAMTWEKLRLAFGIAVDVEGLTWKRIDAAIAEITAGAPAGPAAGGYDPWQVWFQAAKYSLATGQRKAEALVWVEKAMAAKESFWNYELKGDLLVREGRYAEAIPLLDRSIELSKAAGAPEAWRDGARAKRALWVKAGG
jgi:hypothetical protein